MAKVTQENIISVMKFQYLFIQKLISFLVALHELFEIHQTPRLHGGQSLTLPRVQSPDRICSFRRFGS